MNLKLQKLKVHNSFLWAFQAIANKKYFIAFSRICYVSSQKSDQTSISALRRPDRLVVSGGRISII